jgi:surfeit locus 1 family protein
MRTRSLLWPTLMTLVALPILIGLGTWQLRRKAWKEGLIAAMEQGRMAPPISLDAALDLARDPAAVQYRRVRVTGRFHNDLERYFYDPDPTAGPGFDVTTPLVAEDGAIVWVNRGYVPEALRDPMTRTAGEPDGTVTATGFARLDTTKPAFVPPNEPNKNLWFWRDVPALTASAFPEAAKPKVAPFILDAEAEPKNPGGWPRGGTTVLELPNRHLEYALTWYGLAAALIAVYATFVFGRRGD